MWRIAMTAPEHYPIHERIKSMELGRWKEHDSRALQEMTMELVWKIHERLYGNGERGLIEEVHDNTKFRKWGYGVIGVLFSTGAYFLIEKIVR
jgi:hypothetical protein